MDIRIAACSSIDNNDSIDDFHEKTQFDSNRQIISKFNPYTLHYWFEWLFRLVDEECSTNKIHQILSFSQQNPDLPSN